MGEKGDDSNPLERRNQPENLMPGLNGALERFYCEHRRQLFTCALAVTRCPERAEDAIQEAFSRLFRLRAEPENLKSYVFRSVRNAAVDQVRRRPTPVEVDMDFIFDPEANPRADAQDKELHRRIGQALLEMPENERETITLHLYADLTFREIAELTEAPLGTVTSWYRRGIEKLRSLLEE